MKDHAQFADNLALYAMDALDDPQELTALQSHLSSCGECRRELEALRADTALLALSATGPLPPQRARQRLLRAVAAEPRSVAPPRSRFVLGRLQPRWLSLVPVMVAAMLAVISIGLILNNVRIGRKYDRLAAQYKTLQKDSALAREVMEMINDPRAMRVTLVAQKSHPQPEVKTIYKQDKGHILLMASNLQPIPDDKVYELWLIPMSGSPMPAGTFRIDPKGSAMMMHAMESEGVQAKAFAITVEPAGGSQTPTMPIVLAPS
ncbi:MAG TPA: anti-sigma factor [Terriglobales bacterium]|nr:anti-sigma factor [Terriglobales bacterium]